MEVKEVPRAVLTAIAEQVDIPASACTSYGERENTLYGHWDELRRECGFCTCSWREYLLVARSLLAEAMESDRPLPHLYTTIGMVSGASPYTGFPKYTCGALLEQAEWSIYETKKSSPTTLLYCKVDVALLQSHK